MSALLYWPLLAIDVAALGLWLLLGLAAAGSDRSHPALVVLLLFVLPALPLLGSAWLFLKSGAPWARPAALAIVAAPLLLLTGLQLWQGQLWQRHANPQGELTFFTPGANRALVEAIQRRDAAAIRAMGSQADRPDVNARGLQGMTALVMALRELRLAPQDAGLLAVLKALLEGGADPNRGGADEWPLEMALQIDDRTGPEPVAMLLQAGADPNRRNGAGVPIFFGGAGHGSPVSTLQQLVRHGADLRATDSRGQTVLHHAAQAGNWPVVMHLLDQGLDPGALRSARGEGLRQMVEAARQIEANKRSLAAAAGNAAAARAADDPVLLALAQRLKAAP